MDNTGRIVLPAITLRTKSFWSSSCTHGRSDATESYGERHCWRKCRLTSNCGRSPGISRLRVARLAAGTVLAMGDQAFQELTSDEQQATDLLLWTGCCMHKELNAVKGGVTSMAAVWSKLGLAPPIQLKNKFESAQSATVDSQANPRKQEGDRGAVKLTSRYFFEVYLPI